MICRLSTEEALVLTDISAWMHCHVIGLKTEVGPVMIRAFYVLLTYLATARTICIMKAATIVTRRAGLTKRINILQACCYEHQEAVIDYTGIPMKQQKHS